MSMIQLDPFEIAEANAPEAAVSNQQKSVSELVLGDVIYVRWLNGVEWEDACDYYQVDLSREEFRYLGHDETYRVPEKKEILPRMIERLKQIPFTKRLGTFWSFQSEYPYLSYTYNAGMNPLNDAWYKAIVGVTTLGEVLAAYKTWNSKAKLLKEVVNFIQSEVFLLTPEMRYEQLKRIRWSTFEYSMDGGDNWSIWSFNRRMGGMYNKLIVHMMSQFRTSAELVKLAEMHGADQDSRETQTKPNKFWIEER